MTLALFLCFFAGLFVLAIGTNAGVSADHEFLEPEKPGLFPVVVLALLTGLLYGIKQWEPFTVNLIVTIVFFVGWVHAHKSV